MASPHMPNTQAQTQYQLSKQQTMPLSAVPPLPPPVSPATPAPTPTATAPARRNITRIAAIAVVIVLAVILYFTWHTSTPTQPSPGITPQNFGNTASSSKSTASTADTGTIEVYVVGAVKHPGVYTLPSGARIYELLQAAGGPLPNANLVALNLAAKLNDGQEVYVTIIGETPPTYVGGVPGTNGSNSGQLVNINTASADEMHQKLHISATTAQNIVNYRLQHGNFTSVDQLLQAVSKSTYDKIKGMVTV